MKHLLFLFVALSISLFAQVQITGDASAKINGEKTFQSWSLEPKIYLSPRLSISGFLRGTRDRNEATGEDSPRDCARIGLSYSASPFIAFGVTAGALSRRTDGEIKYSIGAELFFGKVNTEVYCLRKQFFGYIAIEKNQVSKKVFIDGRLMFPVMNIVAGGIRVESDLGWGPHLEVKIPYSEDGHYKAIYLYGSRCFKGKETSTVIGARITVF